MHIRNRARQTNPRRSLCIIRGMELSGEGREAGSRQFDVMFWPTRVNPILLTPSLCNHRPHFCFLFSLPLPPFAFCLPSTSIAVHNWLRFSMVLIPPDCLSFPLRHVHPCIHTVAPPLCPDRFDISNPCCRLVLLFLLYNRFPSLRSLSWASHWVPWGPTPVDHFLIDLFPRLPEVTPFH